MECLRSERYRYPLSLLFIDVDDFKKHNDTYGHKEGDLVLIKLADCLRDVLRATDMAFRLGGEEFTVLLMNADADNAFNVAERLRTTFSAIEIRPKTNLKGGSEKVIYKTISIGISEYKVGMSPSEFVHKADEAMYKAKRRGKNRTEL